MMKSFSEDFTGLLWQLDGPSFVAGCWFHPVSPEFKVCFVLLLIGDHHLKYGEGKKVTGVTSTQTPNIFCKPNNPSHLTPVLCASFTFLNSKATHLALPSLQTGEKNTGSSNQQAVSITIITLWQFNLDHLPTENGEIQFQVKLPEGAFSMNNR